MLDAGAPAGTGLFTFFDLRTDFAIEWYRARTGSSTGALATIDLDNLSSRFLLYAISTVADNIIATNIAMLAKGDAFNAADVAIAQKATKLDGTDQTVAFKPGKNIDLLTGIFSADGRLQLPMTSWPLSIKQSSLGITGLWKVVRYSLT